MSRDRSRYSAVRIDEGSRQCSSAAWLAFVGNPISFSDRILRLVEAEFGDLDLHRFNEVSALGALGEAERTTLRLVVLDETFCSDLLSRPRAYRALAGQGRLVLAYRDAEVAGRLVTSGEVGCGASVLGLLPMNAEIDVWLSVLRLLLHGEAYIPAQLLMTRQPATADAEPEPCRNGTDAAVPPETLTHREREVLSLVSEGAPNKRIATHLGLSEHTVKLHIHNIITKLGVKNRTGAANWFLSRPAGAGRARSFP